MTDDSERRNGPVVNAEAARSLWAITSYFNPVGYVRRLGNYRAFRKKLMVPLVTVELARERAKLQLQPDEADILIQLTGEDLLWQKERLLNLAVGALPPECREVAWLDCDIVLEADDWPRHVSDALTRFPLVQAFARFYELSSDADLQNPESRWAWGGGQSFCRRLATGVPVDELFRRNLGDRIRRGQTVGLAWAARRRLLDAHGLYDGCILGGGDKAILVAALGRLEFLHSLDMNERQTAHYLSWAQPFFEDVRANIGYVDATVFHLWHGELKDRKHRRRHAEFKRFGFDPFVDIAIDGHGCWRWTTANAEMRAYLKHYFEARNEDGASRSTPAS